MRGSKYIREGVAMRGYPVSPETQRREDKEIMTGFRMLRTRQVIALSATLVLLVLLALLYRRPDLFGEFSKGTIDAAQIVLIVVFIAFSLFNWRCPSCKKYLGADISRRTCRRCGARLR